MNLDALNKIANRMVEPGKGILAADESTSTMGKRMAAIDVENTAENRRDYRELMFSAKEAMGYISGVILYDETIWQDAKDGTPLVKLIEDAGSIPGIKVDEGVRKLASARGDEVTRGLDKLHERLPNYYERGARFAKWRAVIDPTAGRPSYAGLVANAHALARYAALCQEAGLVPIVEPEVLMEGVHTLARCAAVSAEVLHAVFDELDLQSVLLEGMLLKPNMVLPGLTAADQSSVDAVADATVTCLLRTVPAAVPGVAFLSGGQSAKLASARLNAMNLRFRSRLPWALSFSFARAIQQPALEAWRGLAENVPAAQEALFHRADCNRAARRGDYDASADAPRST